MVVHNCGAYEFWNGSVAVGERGPARVVNGQVSRDPWAAISNVAMETSQPNPGIRIARKCKSLWGEPD